jgi:hypothetical protein
MQFFSFKARGLYCSDFAAGVNDTRVPVSCRAIYECDTRAFNLEEMKN